MDEQKLDEELFDDTPKADEPNGDEEEKKDEELFDEEEDEENEDDGPRVPSELTGKDAEKLASVVQRKSMALDKEKKRRKALEMELEQLKGKGAQSPSAPSIDPAAIAEQVRESLRKEEETKRKESYRNSAKEEIKKLYQSTSIAKEEAKELLKIIDTLPQTGNPEDDVAFALSWHKTKTSNAHSTMPSFNGSAMSNVSQSTTRGEISQAALEFAKVNAGMDEEEFKKFYARRTKPTIFSNKR